MFCFRVREYGKRLLNLVFWELPQNFTKQFVYQPYGILTVDRSHTDIFIPVANSACERI